MDQSGYNRFLDLVYDATVDPHLWPRMLESLADMTGAQTALIIQQDEETGKGHAIRVNTDPAAAEPYYGYFATRNVLHNTPDPRETVRRWTPCVLTDEDKLSKSALMRTEYYNDFMRRFDLHSLLMVRLAIVGMESVTINLTRPARRGRFEAAEIDLVKRLHPHLIRAFGLGQKFAATERLKDDIASSLDRSPHGLFLLDGAGRVRHLNQAAQDFLAEAGGLRLVGGALSAARSDAARRLEGLIATAAAIDPDLRRGGSMALRTPARRLPLSVTVAPARVDQRPMISGERSVIVCVSDLEAGVSLPEQTARELFGLTQAEARVALALFEGATPREAADNLGVSIQTIRVHLSHIFEKTETRGQTDLVRLMTRAISAIGE